MKQFLFRVIALIVLCFNTITAQAADDKLGAQRPIHQ